MRIFYCVSSTSILKKLKKEEKEYIKASEWNQNHGYIKSTTNFSNNERLKKEAVFFHRWRERRNKKVKWVWWPHFLTSQWPHELHIYCNLRRTFVSMFSYVFFVFLFSYSSSAAEQAILCKLKRLPQFVYLYFHRMNEKLLFRPEVFDLKRIMFQKNLPYIKL